MKHARTGRKATKTGATFEKQIETANRYYEMHRHGMITKIPTGTRMVGKQGGRQIWQPAEKTGCDYIGVYHGLAVAIEAKSTEQKTRFPLTVHQKPMVKEHQLRFLEAFERSGGKAYILINFRPNKETYRVPIGEYRMLKEKAEAEGKKSIPVFWFEDCTQVQTTGYVLNYLAGIEEE